MHHPAAQLGHKGKYDGPVHIERFVTIWRIAAFPLLKERSGDTGASFSLSATGAPGLLP